MSNGLIDAAVIDRLIAAMICCTSALTVVIVMAVYTIIDHLPPKQGDTHVR